MVSDLPPEGGNKFHKECLKMSDKYTLTIAGLERSLPICPIDDTTSIAAFVLFTDVELTVAAAKELLKRSPEFDVIVTAESKGIPLAYEMSRQSGKPYIVARKTVKLYMQNPVSVNVKSITTAAEQTLHLGGNKAHLIDGKRVLIVDDVISTGESLHALEKLIEQIGGKIVAKEAVLAEGSAAERDDIIFLEKLPLFKRM